MGKSDRMARMLNVMLFLHQNPQGLTVPYIAQECNVSTRTIYRDLLALESEIHVPIFQEGRMYRIMDGYFLPPVHFTVPEALNIFLAARLMSKYIQRYDPTLASTFFKLNTVVPNPLKEQIQKTINWLEAQKRDENYLGILSTIADAWINGNSVNIKYRGLSDKDPVERIIDPYFIEPAAGGHSSYVIGYCHKARGLRTFKIERISAAKITDMSYHIPKDFDADTLMSSAWGIVVGGEAESIKLKFTPRVARILEEVVWHPSQKAESQPDGSLIMSLTVQNTFELTSWILSWGESVEVLEPEVLRIKIAQTVRTMLDIYR